MKKKVEWYCCVLKLSVDPQVDLPAWWPAYLHTRIFANLIWNLVWMLFFPAGRSSYLKSRIFISFLFIISRFLILWNLSFSLGLWSLDVCILRNSRIQQEEQNNNNYTGLREMQAMYKSPSFAIHLSRQQLINTFSSGHGQEVKVTSTDDSVEVLFLSAFSPSERNYQLPLCTTAVFSTFPQNKISRCVSHCMQKYLHQSWLWIFIPSCLSVYLQAKL